MSRQKSPFEALTGAEKQIRWLEYQSIRLPYQNTAVDEAVIETSREDSYEKEEKFKSNSIKQQEKEEANPSHIIPRTDFSTTRHRQYDAVIARLKQAEAKSRGSVLQSAQQ